MCLLSPATPFLLSGNNASADAMTAAAAAVAANDMVAGTGDDGGSEWQVRKETKDPGCFQNPSS